MQRKSLLTYRDLEIEFGLKRVRIWRKVKSGDFPTPMDLGGGRVAWTREAVDTWVKNLTHIRYTTAGGNS